MANQINFEATREANVAKKKTIRAADLFCGAGGTSQGLLMAANQMKADLELIAINHWNVAIDTHSINHPYAQHLCTGLDNVDPRKLVPGGRLNLLCGSPECTHHSVARGGKPMSDQSRSSAWHILRFAEALYIDNLIIENVPEFQSWGPLGANGRPLKSKRGHLFQQFIASLRALGYTVEWRVLNCADYGDPTTRRRLFIIARRNKAIRWPEPTHVPAAMLNKEGLFADDRKPWRSAREIIDWSILSKSIFDRKKPLADKTLSRIQAGLKKFCNIDVDLKRCFAEDLRPFLVVLRGTGTAASVDEPLHTVTASGNHYGLVEPYLMQIDQHGGNGSLRSADSPIATLVTKENTAVVEPVIIPPGKAWRRDLNSVGDPIVEPFIVPQGRWHEARDINRPLDSITTTSRGVGLAEPFLTYFRGDHAGREDGSTRNGSLDNPLPTQDCSPRFGMVEPFMVTVNHGEGASVRQARSLNEPMPTTTQKIGEGICQPFLIAYYGTKNMSEAGEPLPTVTTKERFGLICPTMTQAYAPTVENDSTITTMSGSKKKEKSQNNASFAGRKTTNQDSTAIEYYRLDIRFRMLQPRELARAQGFPDNYVFTGNREAVVKQIGNAVPPHTAKALIAQVLGA